ncbi:hypothetical protein ZWY2020_001121 [Hordeum vulgare]|nr:hypothetical protein ZWY2020_001121 [Hordeum vulgare]
MFSPATVADGLLSAFFKNGDMEMLNNAFLKGMEEGNKFLPTNNTSSRPSRQGARLHHEGGGANGTRCPTMVGPQSVHDEDDRRRRPPGSKSMMRTTRKLAHEMFDEIILEYEMCMQRIQELRRHG